ncbi:hypothetical protein [Pseudoalteromonas sp.]|uniref:hypothetical protein n=1 Tax=Pseudoalteromonas sp. TaxID=53249 RepID=UPI001BCE5578|nr:hypothetical protein [Pseudoalteromonas sp.]
MKLFTLVLLTISLFSYHAVAGMSNKARFIPLLKTKLGNYEVTSSNSGLCINSRLQFNNANDPEQGFSLGKEILFNSLHNGTRTIEQPNYCFITSTLRYKTDGLENSLRMSRCDNPIHEKSIKQSITFLTDNRLKYTLDNPSVECEFIKVAD